MGLHAHDGGAPHWHDEFGEHLAEELSEEEFKARQLDWRTHNVQIVTVGIDIGSSTSHLMFSRLFIQLVGEAPAVRSVVTGREILWASPIILTPYLDADTIDAAALQAFVAAGYTAVGATAKDVDTGAVVLTGEALKRKNAHAIVEQLALDTGQFVVASAGHHLEAMLAANGSGTVARSRRDQRTLLNVDIGGGTTKLALVRDGEILATAAIAIGARLIAKDSTGQVTRLDEPARRLADHLGIELAVGELLPEGVEDKIANAWAGILADIILLGRPEGVAAELMLTDPLPAEPVPQALAFSGGVSEYLFSREVEDFGDLGRPLARALRTLLSNGRITLPSIIDPNLGIRATAIGASLFSTQVGINPFVSDETILPLRNVPVVVPHYPIGDEVDGSAVASSIRDAAGRVDFEDGAGPVAIGLRLIASLGPESARALARGIVSALPRTVQSHIPFVVLVDEADAAGLDEAFQDELGLGGIFMTLEGVTVREFAFLDVAQVIYPSRVVPVTVKSLLFAGGLDRRSIKQALLDAARRGASPAEPE